MHWLFLGFVWAQQVEILHSDLLEGIAGGRRLAGNVHLRQDTLELLCDTAYQQADGILRATGNLLIRIGTQGTLRAQWLSYNPTMKVVELWGDVHVTYGGIKLFTPHLTYYRLPNKVVYHQGGRLVSSRGEIRSHKAEAYLGTQEIFFRQAVRLLRANRILYCDSLVYLAESRLGILLSAGTIRGDRDTLWLRRGYWDDSCGVGYFYGGVRYSDSLGYGGSQQAWWYAEAESLLALCDVWLRAHHRAEGYMADTLMRGRRLFLLGNVTMLSYVPETLFIQAPSAIIEKSVYTAYGGVNCYRQGVWGQAAVAAYDTLQEVLKLSGDAWVAHDKVQLWADTIWFFRGKGRDSAVAGGKAFLALRADSLGRFFHQIQAEKIIAQTALAKLHFLSAFGQVESFYYYKEDTVWRGGNWAQGPRLRIEMDSLGQKPIFIGYYGKTKGYFVPGENLIRYPYYARRFRWRRLPSLPWEK